jgi:hypothetical protein
MLAGITAFILGIHGVRGLIIYLVFFAKFLYAISFVCSGGYLS